MKSNSSRILPAVCIIIILLSLAGNFILWKSLKNSESEIKILNDNKLLLSQDIETLSKKLTGYNNDFKIISDSNYKMVILDGSTDSPTSKAFVFWNPDSEKLYLKVESLPVPPSYMDYHLWVNDLRGQPKDAGIVKSDPADKSLQQMKNIENGKTFIITLEPKKVARIPDMMSLYATGKL